MHDKRVEPLPAAERDFDEITDYYIAEAGEGVAERFTDAMQAAYRAVGAAPGGGSPALGGRIGHPQLRTWNVRNFPYVICYVERADRVDVTRILHAQRDLPAHLNPPSD